MVLENGVHVSESIQRGALVHHGKQSGAPKESGLLDAGCRLLRNRHRDLPVVGKRGVSPVRITKAAFAELFGVHIPEWSPSAWLKGTRYEFVGGSAEIDELERLCGGVTSVKP